MAEARSPSPEEIKTFDYKYKWTIDNYISRMNSDIHMVRSHSFTDKLETSCLDWTMDLWPNGKNPSKKGEITLYLTLDLNVSSTVYVPTKFKLGIVNTKGENVCFINGEKIFKDCDSWGKRKFITTDILFDEKYELFADDKLIIFCEIIALLGNETPLTPLLESNDYRLLLENRGTSDATIIVNEREFPVHKKILAAHSIVFGIMFQCNMQESITNRVEITDIDEGIVAELINYMYNGEINNINEIMIDLLIAADKYEMDALKLTCEKALLESISFSNATDMLILSDSFRLIKFKHKVKKYIVDYYEILRHMHEFLTMIYSHPHLAVEIFQLLSSSTALQSF